METHAIEPVYTAQSTRLILGSFPSVKSREGNFFYHHPQNRFWKVIAYLCQEKEPCTISEKKSLLLRHHIALWDVIQSCHIIGSSDQSITNVVVNDITTLLDSTAITMIYTNGNVAHKLYHKHIESMTHIPAISLPSTSPANAQYTVEALCRVWKERMGIDYEKYG